MPYPRVGVRYILDLRILRQDSSLFWMVDLPPSCKLKKVDLPFN